MSALSKLRVSLAQNANVAEQILTRDFKKSMLLETQDKSQKLHSQTTGPGGKSDQSRNLKSGVSTKKGKQKDKKNQRIVKIGDQFSGKKLSTKSSLQIQYPLSGQYTQIHQPNQMLNPHL